MSMVNVVLVPITCTKLVMLALWSSHLVRKFVPIIFATVQIPFLSDLTDFFTKAVFKLAFTEFFSTVAS